MNHSSINRGVILKINWEKKRQLQETPSKNTWSPPVPSQVDLLSSDLQ
jgi:hypothetical protein